MDRAHLRLHRGHDRRMGMPAEHRHIRGIEVDVAEPVDVSEARALPIIDVNRLVIVRCHPRHRRAVRHMRPRPADQRQRPRPGLPEAGQLLSQKLADPRPVKITMRRHTRMLERPGRMQHALSRALGALDNRSPPSGRQSRSFGLPRESCRSGHCVRARRVRSASPAWLPERPNVACAASCGTAGPRAHGARPSGWSAAVNEPCR